MLKHFLSNSEVLNDVSIDDNEKVDSKDENRVVAYLKAFAQVVLNTSSTQFSAEVGIDESQKLKYIAASISIMSEYLFNSTPNIQNATTRNI